MLAQTIVLVALIASFAAAAVAGIAGATRARSAEAARMLLGPGASSALSAYARELAAAIAAQAQAAGNAVPPPPLPLLAGQTGPAPRRYAWTEANGVVTVASEVVPATPVRPVCPADGSAVSGPGPDLEVEAQCSPFVQESRLAVAVVADAGPADAAGQVSPLAHGRTTVTLRLFAQPPYVAIVGIKDAVAAGAPHEGDLGGYGATALGVGYACTPALGDCSVSAPPAPGAPTSLPWTDGN